MLDDDFLGIDDRREIDRLIPLNEMSEVAHELLCMDFPDCQPKFPYGTNREFAQFWFMFHVEQLRESADEVKTFWSEIVKISAFARQQDAGKLSGHAGISLVCTSGITGVHHAGCSKSPDFSPAQPRPLFHPTALSLPRQSLRPWTRCSAGKAAVPWADPRFTFHGPWERGENVAGGLFQHPARMRLAEGYLD